MSTTLVPVPDSESGPAPEPAPQRMLRSFGALLARRRLVAVGVFLLVTAATALGLALTDREYVASAQVAATPSADTTSAASFDDLLGTVAQVAESRPLLAEVADLVPGRSTAQLSEAVDATVVDGTLVVRVSVTDTDPERAAQVANLIIEQLPAHDPSNGTVDLHLTETAGVPEHAVSPHVGRTLLIGVGLAALLGLAAAAATDRAFGTVTDPDELGVLSGTSVLGSIPRPADATDVAAADPEAEGFQSLRALRIAIEFACADDPARLLVVSSAGTSDPWAGWLEVNLGTALASVGHRVLVIDASREGDAHPALAAGGAELYDVLAGGSGLAEAVRPGPVEGIDVLGRGNVELAAPGLLELRFRGLIEDTEDTYDVVIAHAAPVTTSEDARIMAIHGAMLLTVPAGKVAPRTVRDAVEHLRTIRLRVLGSVLLGRRSTTRRRVDQISA